MIAAISDPLYQAARRFLNDEELGLNRWALEPEPVVKEAIRFVSSESHKHRERVRKFLKGEIDVG